MCAMDVWGDETANLVTTSLGCSDRAWNQLCLNTQMHRWWSKALWGFKCLGIEDTSVGIEGTSVGIKQKSTITLQFFWMPSTNTKKGVGKPWDREVYQQGEARKVVQEWNNKTLFDEPEVVKDEGRGSIYAVNVQTFRGLQSGHIVKLSMTRDEAIKMKAMVDLQWAVIKIATMSGAAGDPIFESGYDDDGRPFPGFRMLRDLEPPGEELEEDISDEEVEDVDFQS